jgi:hypothetical protein
VSSLDRLRHHVTGAIERGEAVPIVSRAARYRIVFGNGRRTTLIGDWNWCQYKLERILGYRPCDNGGWVNKHNETAQIVCVNGVPF